jgi:hypothetical protein
MPTTARGQSAAAPFDPMFRHLLSLLASLGFAALASAQCFDQNQLGTYIGNNFGGNGVLFPTHYPLGFAFPMAGSAGTGTWTHFRVCTNGWLVLTNGTTTSGIPGEDVLPDTTPGLADSLYGPSGSNPRIAPLWGDWSLALGGVFYDRLTTPGVCRITWFQAQGNGAPPFTMQAELSASGQVRFHYTSVGTVGAATCAGLSAANGTGAQGSVDLVPGPNSTAVPGMHQSFAQYASLDMANRQLTFTPTASGGWNQAVTCGGTAASHTAYGTGCYTIPTNGIYQFFSTAAQAKAGIETRILRFTPSGTAYNAALIPFQPSAFVPPSPSALQLGWSQDGSEVLPANVFAPGWGALPTPFGPVTSLRVSQNGIVHLGAAASPHDGDFTPSGAEFAACTLPGFYAWHDFNDFEGGQVFCEVVGGYIAIVTFWFVESYASPETSNPSLVQFQFDLSNGTVTMVFQIVDANSTSPRGSSYLVGCKGPGAITDPGSVNLATSLPAAVRCAVLPPMALSASPAPRSTLTTGTLVTYTQSNLPETAPGSGLRTGVTMLSLGQNLPGADLAGLGMPGCSLHLQSIDAIFGFAGAGAAQATQFPIPPGVPFGTQVFAQSAALFAPGSLPNGQNSFGAITSNAIASFVSFY